VPLPCLSNHHIGRSPGGGGFGTMNFEYARATSLETSKNSVLKAVEWCLLCQMLAAAAAV